MSDLPLHIQPYADAIGFMILAMIVALGVIAYDFVEYFRKEHRDAMGRRRRQQKNSQGKNSETSAAMDARGERCAGSGGERQDGDYGSERRGREKFPEDAP